MDGLKTEDLARILGLYRPWQIASVKLDEVAKTLVVQVLNKEYQRLPTPTDGKQGAESVSKRWQHIRLGQYSCFIEVTLPAASFSAMTNELPPIFLGAVNKPITRELSDSIRMAYTNGIDSSVICDLFGLEAEVVDNEISTYHETHTRHRGVGSQLKSTLPATTSLIWHQLLAGELQLTTESMPLKFCLAQQKRTYCSGKSDAERNEAIRKLRQFFQHNANSLSQELKTLIRWADQHHNGGNAHSLPKVDNKIWQDILLDDDLLKSDKVNYRLLVSRLKVNYRRTGDSDCLLQLHDFFSQNARSMEEEIHKINCLAASH